MATRTPKARTPRPKKAELLAEARDPTTPPARLGELASKNDSRLNDALASNPSTPVGWLERLARLWGTSSLVEGNPSWQLAVLERPERAHLIHERKALESRDPAELSELARVSSLAVQKTVASNRHTPSETLGWLASLGENELNWYLSSNPNTPPEALDRMARGGNRLWSDGNLLGNPSTPAETLRWMVAQAPEAERERVLKSALRNPAAPAELIEQAIPYPALHEALTLHPNAPPAALRRLAAEGTAAVKQAAALHPSMPGELLDELAHSASAGVRQAVAENPRSTPHTLELLARDPSPAVRQAAALNPNVPQYLSTRRLACGCRADRAARSFFDRRRTPARRRWLG